MRCLGDARHEIYNLNHITRLAPACFIASWEQAMHAISACGGIKKWRKKWGIFKNKSWMRRCLLSLLLASSRHAKWKWLPISADEKNSSLYWNISKINIKHYVPWPTRDGRCILIKSWSIKSSSPIKIGLDPFTLKVYCLLSMMHEIKSQKVRSYSFSSKADI